MEQIFSDYHKQISSTFKKYSATKEFDKLDEFSNYVPLKTRMNAGEVCKMFRDHSISELFLTSDEVVHIIREVNCKCLPSKG